MKNFDMLMHLRGESIFIDDIKEYGELLHSAIFTSPVAKGIIRKLDVTKAEKAKGVVAAYTAKDIPGENQIGHVIKDQPLLAEKTVEYIGQPIAFIVAKTKKHAMDAFKFIDIDIEQLKPITDPREACEKGELIQPNRIMLHGDVESAWNKYATIIEGVAESGAQEHFYLETQGALSVPVEGGNIKVYASSQAPGGFHHAIADVLDMPMHKIELDIRRLGGAFGGKESCAIWAALSAMAAKLLKKPVKVILNRKEDIATTSKRHPFSTDYKLGLDKEGNIVAYEAMLYQDAGAFADISLPVLERGFLHTVNSYNIPNVKITTACCRTNVIPNGAFRGFGVPQAVFAIESALYKAALKINIPASILQRKNLLSENDLFPFGMAAKHCKAKRCWEELDKKYDIDQKIQEVEKFNKENTSTKKGIAVQPVCFGVSFTQTALNQASALIHVYIDGSIAVSTGAVEMGQGVNMKILLIVAQEFSIDPKRVKVETTNTTRIANASPTAASTGADLNGMAAKIAANEILKRLKKVASDILKSDNIENIEIRDEQVFLRGKETDITWEKLINSAYWSKTSLSCQAYYATPLLHFDREKEKGHPFAYHAYGTSITEVTLDCIRGTYKIDSVNVVHDVGKSLDVDIDMGQIQGGIVQGIGWATIENLVYDKTGKLLTSTSSYKVPDIKFIPDEFNVHFLENADNPYAVCNSKTVGEPPLIHGIGTYFALLNALNAARKDKKETMPSLPITPEKAFMYIHG